MTRERGFALITVVLLMIGLAVLATGLVFAAAQQAAVADSLTDLVRARHGAEAAVGIALDDWRAAPRALDPLGEPVNVLSTFRLDAGVDVSATTERIAPGIFLVTGAAVVRRGALPPIRRTAVRVVHSLDLDGVGAAVDAAVIAGQGRVASGATASGTGGSAALHPDAAELCARWPAFGAAARAPAGSLTVAAGADLSGMPALRADPDAGALPDSIARLRLGTGEPPVSDAAIDATDSVLSIRGGSGNGILVVPGDLVLDGGHTFRGLVVVLGTATLRDASIAGALLAARVDLERGRVSLDRCAVADALVSSAAAEAAYPPARSWLPTFD